MWGFSFGAVSLRDCGAVGAGVGARPARCVHVGAAAGGRRPFRVGAVWFFAGGDGLYRLTGAVVLITTYGCLSGSRQPLRAR